MKLFIKNMIINLEFNLNLFHLQLISVNLYKIFIQKKKFINIKIIKIIIL